MPGLEEEMRVGRTRADDLAEGRRPFWLLVKPENMIFAEADIIVDEQTGELREKFTHVRLRENVIVREGFDQVEKKSIRVIEQGHLEEWGHKKRRERQSEERVITVGATVLKRIAG